jgi:hypothetical protein
MMDIKITSNESLLEDHDDAPEPSHFHTTFCVEAFDHVYEDEDDSEGQEVLVATATARLLRQDEAQDHGESLFDVGDGVDQQTHDMWSAVMDVEAEEFIEGIAGEGLTSLDILYIESMQIIATHRRRGLGLQLLRYILRYGQCGIAVIEPHPLRVMPSEEKRAWLKLMDYTRLPGKTVGIQKLRRYWSQLGFKPVPGSRKRFYYLNLERSA